MKKLILKCMAIMIFCFMSDLPNVCAGVTYTYDQTGRVESADYGSIIINYTYDPAGNLLKRETRTFLSAQVDIKVNDSDGPVSASSAETLWLSIGLSSGSLTGVNADWWIVSFSPAGTIQHMDIAAGTFTDGLEATFQGPLGDFDITPFIPLSNLSAGTYAFYFAIDTNMNGILDIDQLYYDAVIININE